MKKLVINLLIINKQENFELCKESGIIIFPAVFIEGELIFYGEFTIEEALKYARSDRNLDSQNKWDKGYLKL